MRARLLALLAALAVLAGACSNVPGGAVATVNGTAVDADRFERFLTAQVVDYGLDARDAADVQAAIDAGALDRAALDGAIIAEANAGEDARIELGPPPSVPADVLDELWDGATPGDLDAALEGTGVTAGRLRQVFDRLVPLEIRGLQRNNGQTGFALDRSGQVPQLQVSVINQLVQAEMSRQAAEAAGVEVSDADVDAVRQQIVDSFGSEEALGRLLDDLGYTDADLREVVLLPQAIDQAFQALDDTSELQAFFTSVDVHVAERFGTWDGTQGQVLPPTNPV